MVLFTATALLSGCATGQTSGFTLTGASVDAVFTCPAGSADTPYDIHATVDVQNGTSGTVTIRSAGARLALKKIKGTWLEAVGDEYEASEVTFSPATIAPGAKRSLTVTIPSTCTNPKPGAGGASAADYAVTIRLVTSAGTFSTTTGNRHRIVAA